MPCSYCEAHSHLITCADCHQSFCNTFKGTTISHIIFHLKKNGHKRILIDRLIVCELCGQSDVFMLRGVDGMIVCGCCGDGEPVVDGKALVPWVCGGRDEGARSKNDSGASAKNGEEMKEKTTAVEDGNDEKTQKKARSSITRDGHSDDTENKECALPRVQLKYTNQEYISIFTSLITAECEQEKHNKERLTREKIFVRFEHKNDRIFAHFSFCRDEMCARINIGDEVKIFVHTSTLKGFICNDTIYTEENIAEIVNTDVKYPDGEYRMEFPWRNVGYQRMKRALTSLKKKCAHRITQLIWKGKVKKRKSAHMHEIVVPDHMPPLNECQKIAIDAALNNHLTLVQGPPGTGKTITTAAIVYNLLKHKKGKILVVAPSNIAVDNLTRRILKCGIDVLRIVSRNREGLVSDLDDITLHKKVNREIERIADAKGRGDCVEGREYDGEYDVEYDRNRGSDREYDRDKKRDGDKNEETLSNSPNHGHSAKQTIDSEKLSKLMQRMNVKNKKTTGKDRLRDYLRYSFVKDARVITCTCVTAGQELFKRFKFSYVLIDEAVQATEPLTLVPLIYSCRKLILVGDHKQLGPTILNKKAANAGLRVSLFERLIRLGVVPYLLTVQYRMHPVLCEWVSNTFYDGALVSAHYTHGAHARYGTGITAWFNLPMPTFFYVSRGREELFISGTSYLNKAEAQQCLAIIRHLKMNGVRETEVGIITPYEGQRVLLSRLTACEVANVDAFQGREKAFIIISLVRSNSINDIGFVSDRRRMCVALTRAKHGLFIVGNPGTFCKNKMWKELIAYYQGKGVLVEGEVEELRRCEVLGVTHFDFGNFVREVYHE